MRAFAQAEEIFDGEDAARQAENHVDRDEAAELKPRERCAVDAEPDCLPHDDVRFRGRLARKAAVKKIDDGKNCASEREDQQREESPAEPNDRHGKI